MNKSINRKGGFTLVELLAVIAIIAVLAGVVIASIGNATTAAQDASVSRQEQVLNSALQNHIAAGGAAATDVNNTLAALTAATTYVSGITGPMLLTTPPLSMTDGSGTTLNLAISGGQFVYQ